MAGQQQSRVNQVRALFNPGIGWLDKFLWIMERVMYLGCMRVEVFLRSNFGVRYFTTSTFVIVAIFDTYTAKFSEFADKASYFSIFVLAFVFVGVCHKVAAFQQMRKGIITHSQSSGMPHRIWERLPFASFWVIKRFYEPVFCGVVAYCIYQFLDDTLLAISIAGSALLLFIKNNLEFSRLRNIALDQIDAGIENDVMQDVVVEMKSPRETKGVALPGPFPKDRRARQAIVDDFLGRLRTSGDLDEGLVERLAGELEAEQGEDSNKLINHDESEEQEDERLSPFVQNVMNDPEIQAAAGDEEVADQSGEINTAADPLLPPSPPGQSTPPKPQRPGIRLFCATCGKVTTGATHKMVGKYVDCVRCGTPILVADPA